MVILPSEPIKLLKTMHLENENGFDEPIAKWGRRFRLPEPFSRACLPGVVVAYAPTRAASTPPSMQGEAGCLSRARTRHAKNVRYKGLAYSYVRNTAHLQRFHAKATSMSRLTGQSANRTPLQDGAVRPARKIHNHRRKLVRDQCSIFLGSTSRRHRLPRL
jgi:hypothetical protein